MATHCTMDPGFMAPHVELQTALKDTESFVNQRVDIISNDLEQEIEQTQKSLQDSLQGKQTRIQANINTMGENLNKDTQAMQESLQMQIQSMKKDLFLIICWCNKFFSDFLTKLTMII